MARKEAHPDVARYYLALTDDERHVLDIRMKAAGRRLADMRFSKSTGKLDERLLVPLGSFVGRLKDKPRNDDGTLVKSDETPDKITRRGRPRTAGIAMRRMAGKGLREGQTLADWIKENTSDGVELADFYLSIMRMGPKDARNAGVFMSHKLQAANYLVERGWGKPKGDDDEKKQIQINVTNYSEANPPPPPVRQEVIETTRLADAEPDVGTDKPVDFAELDLVDFTTTGEQGHPMSDKEVEEFDLSEDR